MNEFYQDANKYYLKKKKIWCYLIMILVPIFKLLKINKSRHEQYAKIYTFF